MPRGMTQEEKDKIAHELKIRALDILGGYYDPLTMSRGYTEDDNMFDFPEKAIKELEEITVVDHVGDVVHVAHVDHIDDVDYVDHEKGEEMSKKTLLEEKEEKEAAEKETQLENDAQGSPTDDFFNDPNIKALIDEKVEQEVLKRVTAALKGKTPKVSTVSIGQAEIDQFNKLGYKERLHIYNSNPNLYNKLTKRG